MLMTDCTGQIIDANEKTLEMMSYCNTQRNCKSHGCPYKNECDEFIRLYDDVPYLFFPENE